MKFPEFNRVVNPNDEKCYIAKTYSGTSLPMTFADICLAAKTDPTLIIEWIIPKGYLVIETKEKNILPFQQKLPKLNYLQFLQVYVNKHSNY